MIQTKEVELDGVGFILALPPAMRALKLLTRLGKIAGPAVAAIASAAGGRGLKGLDVAAIGGALLVLFERLSPDDFEQLAKELLQGCRARHGDKAVDLVHSFDVVFAGRPLLALKVLQAQIGFTYGDFFSALAGLEGQAAPAGASA